MSNIKDVSVFNNSIHIHGYGHLTVDDIDTKNLGEIPVFLHFKKDKAVGWATVKVLDNKVVATITMHENIKINKIDFSFSVSPITRKAEITDLSISQEIEQ